MKYNKSYHIYAHAQIHHRLFDDFSIMIMMMMIILTHYKDNNNSTELVTPWLIDWLIDWFTQFNAF